MKRTTKEQEARELHEEQLRAAYIEGYRRCRYIKLIEGGYMPSLEDGIVPDDFETFYEKNYGE